MQQGKDGQALFATYRLYTCGQFGWNNIALFGASGNLAWGDSFKCFSFWPIHFFAVSMRLSAQDCPSLWKLGSTERRGHLGWFRNWPFAKNPKP